MTELPDDGFTRQNGRRHARIVMEIEVEITDPIDLRAAFVDRMVEVDGQLVLPGQPVQVFAVAELLLRAATPAVDGLPGVRLVSGAAFPRMLDESGESYAPFPIPPMPARGDDGA